MTQGSEPIAADAPAGRRNLFRHYGYIYDEESGLCGLSSRYYNPMVGWFVNMNTLLEIHGERLNTVRNKQ